MNRPTLPIFFVLLAATAPLTAAEPEWEAIDEIQVTASRRALQQSEVSSAVSIIDSDEFSTANLITDALAAQPGSYLQETTPGQGAVIIRGLKGSEVLHLVDGMRLNNAIFRNAPTQYAALVDPATVASVEVVRGSGASLYGSGAMGGVVNFLTQRPGFGSEGSRGNLSLMANSADLSRKVSAGFDVSGDDTALLTQLTWLNTGNRKTGSGERIPSSGFDSAAARIAMTVVAGDDRTWFLDLQALEQPKTARVDELVAGFGETEPGSSEYFFKPNARYFAHVERRAASALLGADWDVDFAWQRIVDDRDTRAYQSSERRQESNRSDLLLLDVDASWQLANSEWLVGAEWSNDRVRSERQSSEQGQLQPRFPDDSRVKQGALYGNLRLAAGGRSSLTAGVRYNLTRISAQATSLRFSDISGDLGWTFELTDATSLVANVGRGFRAPNIFDLGTLGERPGNRFNIPNSNLEAEHVNQADIGVKVFDESYSFEVFLFALNYEDRIESVPTGDVTTDGRIVTQSQNLATSDLHGVEASAVVQISDSLAVDANLTYTRGTSRIEGSAETDADRVPPLNGRVTLRYSASEQWHAMFHALFADQQDRLSPRDISDPRINPLGTAGWLTLGTELLHYRDNWTFAFGIDNVLDSKYRIHGSGVDARGRNLFGSVRYDW